MFKKKSRLKKLAGFETITLYHTTSSQLFLKIIEEGYLLPSSYTDQQTRPKTNFILRDLANSQTKEKKEVSVLTLIKEKNDYQLSERLQNKINDIIDNVKNNLSDEEKDDKYAFYRELNNKFIEISEETRNPSSGIGVYLTNKEHNEYYLNKVNGTTTNDNLPNFPVELEITVYEDALSPDLYEEFYNGDTSLDRSSDVPLWKQSLEVNEEVIHQGPIDTKFIQRVYFHLDFLKNHHTFVDKTYKIFNEAQENFDELLNSLTANKWIPFEQAKEEILYFYDALQNIDNLNVNEKFPNESKIIRYENQDHNNYYGDDVYYVNLTQQEYNYVTSFEGGRNFNIIMFADSNVYYGFSGANTNNSVLNDFHPEVVVLIDQNEVYCTDINAALKLKNTIDSFISNYKIYYNSKAYWIETLDKSNYDFTYNSFDEIQTEQTANYKISRLKKIAKRL